VIGFIGKALKPAEAFKHFSLFLAKSLLNWRRGRFPDYRVIAGLLAFPVLHQQRVAGTCRLLWPQKLAFRLQWRDRVGITPTSLLPQLGTSVRISEINKEANDTTRFGILSNNP
jgi:hypothetical protein